MIGSLTTPKVHVSCNKTHAKAEIAQHMMYNHSYILLHGHFLAELQGDLYNIIHNVPNCHIPSMFTLLMPAKRRS